MHGSLPTRLRVLRAERGLTLRDAEHETGVDKDTLSKIERGLRHPHDVTLAKIARGYGVPVEDLLEEPALAGKDEASREARPADVHRLFAVHQTKADWREAVDNSQRFRSRAKERLRVQLSLWQAATSKGSSYEKRRE